MRALLSHFRLPSRRRDSHSVLFPIIVSSGVHTGANRPARVTIRIPHSEIRNGRLRSLALPARSASLSSAFGTFRIPKWAHPVHSRRRAKFSRGAAAHSFPSSLLLHPEFRVPSSEFGRVPTSEFGTIRIWPHLPARIVCSRFGPTLTMPMGTPISFSSLSSAPNLPGIEILEVWALGWLS